MNSAPTAVFSWTRGKPKLTGRSISVLSRHFNTINYENVDRCSSSLQLEAKLLFKCHKQSSSTRMTSLKRANAGTCLSRSRCRARNAISSAFSFERYPIRFSDGPGDPVYNTVMSARVTDYKDAVEHLPNGGILVFHDVSWDDYEQLLEEITDRPGLRVSYDAGKLEIMSPLPEHEEFKRFIERMIDTVADELDINIEPRGSATWRKKPDKGAEADTCYYVANADRIIGKRTLDLKKDPPPDLAVEVDATGKSTSKFSIYSAFQVPELWLYDVKRGQLHMYERRGTSYVEISSSRSFPVLTPETIQKFVEQSKSAGQRAALKAFRQWLKQRP
jgi:Uma2 family endonuclease